MLNPLNHWEHVMAKGSTRTVACLCFTTGVFHWGLLRKQHPQQAVSSIASRGLLSSQTQQPVVPSLRNTAQHPGTNTNTHAHRDAQTHTQAHRVSYINMVLTLKYSINKSKMKECCEVIWVWPFTSRRCGLSRGQDTFGSTDRLTTPWPHCL